MTPGDFQRNRYHRNTSRRIVQGVFYIDGKRFFRRIATFDEAGLLADGTSRDKSDRASRARGRLLKRRYRATRLKLLQKHEQKEAGPDVKTLLDEWIASGRISLAAITMRDYEATAGRYLTTVGNHAMRDFSLRRIDRYVAGLGKDIAPASINRHLRNLRAFLHWAEDRGEIGRVPRIRMIREPKRLPGVLPGADAQRLFDHITGRIATGPVDKRRFRLLHQRFMIHALGTGCRLGEIASAAREQIDFQHQLFRVPIRDDFAPKERREKTIPLPTWLLDYWREQWTEYPEERHLLDDGEGLPGLRDRYSITQAFSRYHHRLGIGSGVKPAHGFRAFYATHLRTLGVDAHAIALLLGHAIPQVTEAYMGDPDHEKRQAVNLLSENPPLKLQTYSKQFPAALLVN